ncbi:MAG: DNA polymerase III subunit delta' [Gammaproteobacteria bacterium]|nr:DNA polymerase III subunit delta' [Gammaproteobacteria bacterium]
MSFLNWHPAQLAQLQQRAAQQSLPHALLFQGQAGIGKTSFAMEFARGLLCERPIGQMPCGECHACKMTLAGSHPDLLRIEREVNDEGKVSKEIKIDQIRDLCERFTQTSQFGHYKIAVISPAERMNRNAANSLLKTLEEPVPQTLIILVTSEPSRLLPTIRSRCQRLVFQQPEFPSIKTWLTQHCPNEDPQGLLNAAEGAPMHAVHLVESGMLNLRDKLLRQFLRVAKQQEDPLQFAKQCLEGDSDIVLSWLVRCVEDIALLQADSQQSLSTLSSAELAQSLQVLAKQIDLAEVMHYIDKLRTAKRLLNTNANSLLIFESLMLDWVDITQPVTT